jgi:tetratricopeptide (TPR) repeat protein
VTADITYKDDDVLLSQSLLRRGKARKALEAAIRADRERPSHPNVLEALAEAQLACGITDEADETSSRLTQLIPSSPIGHDLRGRVALRRRRFVEAEAYFRLASNLEPSRWMSMNNLGIALQGQNRQKEAIDAFEAAWHANPKAAQTKRNLFSATQAYVGAGGLIALVFWLHFFHLIARAINVPSTIEGLVFVLGLVGTIFGLWWLGVTRRRKLSPDVAHFYRRQVVRERNLELLRGLFKAGPNTIIALVLVALILDDPPTIFIWILIGIVAIVVWMALAPRLWQRFVLPRFQPDDAVGHSG